MQTVGFSAFIQTEQLPRHLAALHQEGFPDFAIHPPGEREFYASVIFIEPFAGRNLRAFGYDMAPEPIRWAAATRARETGEPALSGKVTLVQEDGADVQPGFVLFVPVYRHDSPLSTLEQRQSALTGWVFSPLRMHDFMQGLLGQPLLQGPERSLDIEVFDGEEPSPDARLFIRRHPGSEHHEPVIVAVRHLHLGGHTWSIRMTSTPRFEASYAQGNPFWVALAGGILTLPLTLLAWVLVRSRYRIAAALQETQHHLAERQRLERTLLDQEQRWRRALDAGGQGVWDWDTVTDRVYFSPLWKAMLGYAEEEIGDRLAEWESRVHPEDLPVCHRELQRHFAGETPSYRSEYRMRCKDGRYHWIVDQGMVCEWTADHQPRRVLGTHTDITWRKEAEAQLRQSEERYRLLFDYAADAIILVDTANGQVISVNEQACQQYGYGRDDFLHLSLQDLDTPEEAPKIPARLALIARAGKIAFEGVHRHAEGRAIPVEVRAVQIRLDGKPAIMTICRDISARKQTEEALARSHAELEQAQAIAHLGSWTLDFASGRSAWSQEVYRISGMAPGEPVDAQTHVRLVHPDDFAVFDAAWQATLRGAPYDITHRIIVHGEVKWVHARAEIAFDAAGQPRTALGTLQDISERQRYEQEIQAARATAEAANLALQDSIAELNRLATTDTLTGSWNRRYFEQAFAFEGSRAERYGERFSLLLFDIDHFKVINDRHGHQVGDQVLIELCHQVRHHLRAADVFARWGGEEFTVLLPHCPADEAVKLAEKLRHLVAEQPFPVVGRVTASFGVAEFHARETLDAGMRRVDEALYQAKAAGRNQVRVANH